MSVRAVSAGKVFVNDKSETIPALENVTFAQDSREFLCLVGPTGCGKTTLLRLIAGLEQPTAGEIFISEKLVTQPQRVGMVFQHYSLFPWRTALGNVIFPLELGGNRPRKEISEKARSFLALVGLEKFAHSYPYEMSGGMQQRVAIARALACEPEMLLMDEPFGALDEKTRHYLQDEMIKIWEKEKKSVIFVTHNIDEALYLADRILVISGQPGRIVKDLKITLDRPRDRLAKEFVDLHVAIREAIELIISEKKEKK